MPGEINSIEIKSIGEIKFKLGISFYKNGNIKSIEPAKPINIKTRIGNITAYNTAPIGIHGEKNSLEFYENGEIKSISVSYEKIFIYKNGNIIKYKPKDKVSVCNDNLKEINPIKIEFLDEGFIIENDKYKYCDIEKVEILEYLKEIENLFETKCG
ncbi:MAG: hypothetical protein PWP46_941 [Fusobacteriaceae bacterium]|jgi:hypothetical protein|nr:hypothetical protein [Fusobacteriales bacterium]MDN5304062.1 hypothetical protein [Fusobacteriaceae bacterium]